MKKVIIYKGTKTPTQAGNAKTKFWYMKFEENNFYEVDLMTGWKGGVVPKNKLRIKFSSLDRAVEYAKKKNYEFEILYKVKERFKVKSYSDNFKFNRNKPDND